jgi:hypothetical protein
MIGSKPRTTGKAKASLSWRYKDAANETAAWLPDVQRLLQEAAGTKLGAEFIAPANLEEVVEPEMHHSHGGAYYEPFELYWTDHDMHHDIARDHVTKRSLMPTVVVDVELNNDSRTRVIHEPANTRYKCTSWIYARCHISTLANEVRFKGLGFRI